MALCMASWSYISVKMAAPWGSNVDTITIASSSSLGRPIGVPRVF